MGYYHTAIWEERPRRTIGIDEAIQQRLWEVIPRPVCWTTPPFNSPLSPPGGKAASIHDYFHHNCANGD